MAESKPTSIPSIQSDDSSDGKFEIHLGPELSNYDGDSDDDSFRDTAFPNDDDHNNEKNMRGGSSHRTDEQKVDEFFLYSKDTDLLLNANSSTMNLRKSMTSKKELNTSEETSNSTQKCGDREEAMTSVIHTSPADKNSIMKTFQSEKIARNDRVEHEIEMVGYSGEGSTEKEFNSPDVQSRDRFSNKPLLMPSSDEFVRRGTCLRLLLQSTIKKVVHNLQKRRYEMFNESSFSSSSEVASSKRARSSFDDTKRRREHYDIKFAQELAREKMSTCTILERKLHETQTQNINLRKEISILKASKHQANMKLSRTLEALRIAGTQTASAKAENEASEARTKLLSNQLLQMQASIKDTIANCNKVKMEHEDITNMARDLESRLMAADADLVRSRKDCIKLKESEEVIRNQHALMKEQYKNMQEKLNEVQQELLQAKRLASAKDEVEKIRKFQIESVEKQLREANSHLLKVSTAKSESESTSSVLKEAIQEIRKENEKLNKQISDLIENRDKESKKREDALMSSESEAQQLKIKCATGEEELKRSKLDKDETEKYIQQLKGQVANLKKQLVDQQYHHDSNLNSANNSIQNQSTLFSFKSTPNIPKLTPTFQSPKVVPENDISRKGLKMNDDYLGTRNNSFLFSNITASANISSHNKVDGGCALCSKKPYGLMKSCDCGDISCSKRAHAICLSTKAKEVGSTVAEVSILCKKK